MDDTRHTRPDPDPVGPAASPGTGEAILAALEALEAASPADAPDHADAVAERLGAVLGEEGEDADPATA